MRAVVQRVTQASVTVDGQVTGAIDDPGLLVLVGVTHDDTAGKAGKLARKLWGLRILDGEKSCADLGAPLLVVSQFTLYGDTRKGRRPSFIGSAGPDLAVPLYEAFVAAIRAQGVPTATGRFGAMMDVELVNEGPVTLIVDTP